MPLYHVPDGDPRRVEAATPLAAIIAANLWEKGGWAEIFEENPDWVRDRLHRTLRANELAAFNDERVVASHDVGLRDLMVALELYRPRLEEY